jgi:hypothetical protein
MNPPVRPSGTGRRTAPVRYRDHTVIGSPAQIRNVIANHRAAGTLIAVDPPETLRPGTHTVRVRLRLRDTPPAPSQAMPPAATLDAADPAGWRTQRRRRLARISAVAVAVAAPALGVVAAAAYLIGQLVEWVTAHAATLAGLTLLALLITAAIRRSSGKRHCPGC